LPLWHWLTLLESKVAGTAASVQGFIPVNLYVQVGAR